MFFLLLSHHHGVIVIIIFIIIVILESHISLIYGDAWYFGLLQMVILNLMIGKSILSCLHLPPSNHRPPHTQSDVSISLLLVPGHYSYLVEPTTSTTTPSEAAPNIHPSRTTPPVGRC